MRRWQTAVIILLLGVVVLQGWLLYGKRGHSGTREQPAAIPRRGAPLTAEKEEKLLSDLMEKFKKDTDSSSDILDGFFDDDFFAGSEDPFREMEALREKMLERFRSDRWDFFEDSWDGWYGSRFGTEGIEASQKEEPDRYVITVHIPDMKENSVNVDINRNRISIECDIKKMNEEKDQAGQTYFRSSSHSRFSRILPVPEGADTSHAEVRTEGDTVTITIPKVL